MELNKNNESKNTGRKTASSVLLAGLILCTLVIVIFSYATSNHIISNATAQNTPKKVLIVTTSHNILGKTGYPTGLWLPEMTHPFSALQNAGLNITVAGAILMIVQSVNAQSQNDTAQ